MEHIITVGLVDQVEVVVQIMELEVQEQQGHQDRVMMVVTIIIILQAAVEAVPVELVVTLQVMLVVQVE